MLISVRTFTLNPSSGGNLKTLNFELENFEPVPPVHSVIELNSQFVLIRVIRVHPEL